MSHIRSRATRIPRPQVLETRGAGAMARAMRAPRVRGGEEHEDEGSAGAGGAARLERMGRLCHRGDRRRKPEDARAEVRRVFLRRFRAGGGRHVGRGLRRGGAHHLRRMTTRPSPWPRLASIADGLILSALFVTAIVLLLATSTAPWGQ